jgi:kumamolisin
MKCRPYFHLPRDVVVSSWSLPALCGAYGLPRNLTGGNHIGIVELGGTYSPADMRVFCNQTGMPMPLVENATSPFSSDPQGANIEVALDMQVAAFVNWWCTGQVPTLDMIWDLSSTIYAGIASAIDAKCDTCSISWGAAENEWGASNAADLANSAWVAGGSGMAVLAASGDNDFTDGELGRHVDLPAAAPSVIGCSGTTKTAVSETCWNNDAGEGSGGGFSTIWRRPKWQTGTPKGKPINWGRAVGDVSANADPNTGYRIVCGSESIVVGGTSAVAPFWAGLLAAIKAHPGFCTWQLYAKRQACFTPVTQGNNGKWPATIVNGLGAPTGATIGNVLA